MKQLFVLVFFVVILGACSGKRQNSSVQAVGDSVALRYAANLSLVEHADYTVATLRNPWDTTKVLQTYVLIDQSRSIPDVLPNGIVLRTPINNALIYSAVHCSLLRQLDALKQIGGVCDLPYIQLKEIHEACHQGTILDAGDAMNPDMEKIIDLHPDAILLSPFENSGGYGRIEKLRIPIVECADYMETSALGRAEWVRFYGRLFGKAAEADTLFAHVEREYLSLCQLAAMQEKKPTVLCELKSSSAWYVPGGQSTMAGFYADAGATYIFANNGQSGSVPLAFETVFDKGADADFWLIKYNQPTDKTYGELAKEFAPYTGFRAFKEQQVYGCNTGRFSLYEDFPFHPEWLLKDLIKLFHPSLFEEYELNYFTKLTD